MRYQWKPFRSLATVSGLLGQVRKEAAKVGITVCREEAGKVSAQLPFLIPARSIF